MRLDERLATLKARGLYRQVVSYTSNATGELIDASASYADFASNDYLSLNHHPMIRAAYIEGVERFGVGSNASSMVTGLHPAHLALQTAFAKWLDFDEALLLASGFAANIAVLSTLVEKDSDVFIDKCCHASIYDGLKQHQLRFKRFHHCDDAHLASLLKRSNATNKWIVAESVYSMTGRRAPLRKLAALATKHQARLMIDDAHGIGVLHGGRSASELLNKAEIDVLVCPLGKAFVAHGAMVLASKTFIEGLRQFTRSYTYSTALPAFHAHGLLTTLHCIQHSERLQHRLSALITYFKQQVKCLSLPFLDSDTAIQYLPLGDSELALTVQLRLKKAGFLVAAIREPTVAKRATGLRLVLHVNHSEQLIDALLATLQSALA